jgi:ribosomal small subunit protein bTHX
MGKGDKKSRRGKIIIGSHGVRRSRKKKNKVPATAAAPKEQLKRKPDVVGEPEVKETIIAQELSKQPEVITDQPVSVPDAPVTTEPTEPKEAKPRATVKKPTESHSKKTEKKEEKSDSTPTE